MNCNPQRSWVLVYFGSRSYDAGKCFNYDNDSNECVISYCRVITDIMRIFQGYEMIQRINYLKVDGFTVPEVTIKGSLGQSPENCNAQN